MTKDNFCECDLNRRQKSVIYYWQTFLPPCWTCLKKALRLVITIAHNPTRNSRRWWSTLAISCFYGEQKLSKRMCQRCSVTQEKKPLPVLAKRKQSTPDGKSTWSQALLFWTRKAKCNCFAEKKKKSFIFVFCSKWTRQWKKLFPATTTQKVNPTSYLSDGSFWLTAT